MLQLIGQMLEVGRRLITSSCLRKPSLIEFYWKWLIALFGFRRDMTYFSLWDTDTDALVHHLIVSLSKKVWTHCTHVFPILYQCQNNPRTRTFFVLMSIPEIHKCVYFKKIAVFIQKHTRMLWHLYSSSWICIHEMMLQTPALDFTVEISRFSKQPCDVNAFRRATFCVEMNFKISNSINSIRLAHTRFISQPCSVAHPQRWLQDRRTVRTWTGDELPHNFFSKMSWCQHQHSPKDPKNICR